jgi:mRNA interferase YafQ
MRDIIRKKQFKKDFQSIARTGVNLERFAEAVTTLQRGDALPAHFRDHSLIGNWRDFRECHLAGDLLLIYQTTGTELILVRMGSHSELFG